jgi:hypothetical protein
VIRSKRSTDLIAGGVAIVAVVLLIAADLTALRALGTARPAPAAHVMLGRGTPIIRERRPPIAVVEQRAVPAPIHRHATRHPVTRRIISSPAPAAAPSVASVPVQTTPRTNPAPAQAPPQPTPAPNPQPAPPQSFDQHGDAPVSDAPVPFDDSGSGPPTGASPP